MGLIKKHLESCICNIRERGKKRFEITDIEQCVIRKSGGNSKYSTLGGYSAFYGAVVQLNSEGIIKPVIASFYNGMNPSLKSRWGIVDRPLIAGWSASFIMQVSDHLDMSGYIRNHDWQTDEEKEYIINIYNFLEQAENREWASCEERSLELFGNEKFLSTENKKVLTRLSLSFEDLKMKKYGQMFSYWTSGKLPEGVVILENHSTFFSFKRCTEEGIDIFGFIPDLVIFGDGKRIVKSLEFLNEITDISRCKIRYFGDVDPEGWLIYKALREKYSDIDIRLFIPCYEHLLNSGKSYPIGDIMQSTNINILKFIIDEFERNNKQYLSNRIEQLWMERKRIPQELLTFETMKLKLQR